MAIVIIIMNPGPASDINPKHLLISLSQSFFKKALSHKGNNNIVSNNISIRQQLLLIPAGHNGLGTTTPRRMGRMGDTKKIWRAVKMKFLGPLPNAPPLRRNSSSRMTLFVIF